MKAWTGWVGSGLLLLGGVAGIAAEPKQQPVAVNIEAQAMDQALNALAQQTGVQLLFRADALTQGLTAPRVVGSFTVRAALERLLANTELSYQFLDERTVTIRSARTRNGAPEKISAAETPRATGIRLAQVEAAGGQAAGQDDASLPSSASHGIATLEEVRVTATKRGDLLLKELPASITVIGQDRIEKAGMDDFIDYVRTVPGLGFNLTSPAGGRDDIRGGRRLNLRGIEGGFDGNPTTAFYLDEVPVPVMDPKLFDVSRVEVLRGPQGTLYGANSMGGAVRVVMNKPVQNALEYAADLTLSSTAHGEESSNVNAMLNVPLIEDKVALRGVMFYRNEGGFIDHVLGLTPSGAKLDVDRDINDEESWGVRVAAAFQLTPALRITPSVFHQEISIEGTGRYEPDFSDLSYYFQRPFLDRQENPFTLSNLEINYSLTDTVELVSSTSYFESDFDNVEDNTKGVYGYLGDVYGNYRAFQTLGTERFVQELRLAYSGARWNGVIGAFYMDDQRAFDQYDDSSTLGNLFSYRQSNGDEQIALFGEATLNLTARLAVTAGARWFEGRQDQRTDVEIIDGGVVYVETFSGKAKGSAISPKVQIGYDLADGKLLYASAAKGFRPGGPTSLVPATPLCLADLARLGISRPRSEFDPDELWNYELGTKASFAEGRLATNAAVYYIDWKDSQQSVSLDCGYSFVGNVGQAESRGFELEVEARPVDALSLAGTLGYTDAKFSKTSPEVGVVAGDRFAQVPKWTASLAAQYAFPVFTGRDAYLRADYQYVDSMLEGNVETLERPAFETLNLRFGLNLTERTELTLFFDNVFDERGTLSTLEYLVGPDVGGLGLIPDQFIREKVTIRPRTFGLTIRFRG